MVEAVGTAVLGGGCGAGEVRGVGVDGGGEEAVRRVRVVEGGAGGEVEGGGEVRETVVASEDAVEGVTVVVAVVTTVDAEDVDVFSGATVSGRVG